MDFATLGGQHSATARLPVGVRASGARSPMGGPEPAGAFWSGEWPHRRRRASALGSRLCPYWGTAMRSILKLQPYSC